MATISLEAKIKLRDQKSVIIYYRNQRWKTGISVNDPKEFSKGKLNSKYSGPEDYKELNRRLSKRLHFFNKLINEALEKQVDTLDYINAHIEKEEQKLKKLRVTHNTNIADAFEEYLKTRKKNVHEKINSRTFDRYRSQLNRLKYYQTIKSSKISEINLQWIQDFAVWLSQPYTISIDVVDTKNDRKYTAVKTLVQTNPTIKRFIQDLIVFLKYLRDGQPELVFPISDIVKYKNWLASPNSDSEDVISLTKEQQEAYKRYQPRNEWEQETYDLFLFCIQTGLRYSDVTELYYNHIKENNWIQMRAVKTRAKFEVLMNPIALSIFQRYGKDFRNKFVSNQQINENLRTIMERIPEFHQEMIIHEYVLAEEKELVVKGYEVITFHSSRRTFVSNVVKKGATLDQVSKWTGWTDIRTLTHYLNVFGNNDKDAAILNN